MEQFLSIPTRIVVRSARTDLRLISNDELARNQIQHVPLVNFICIVHLSTISAILAKNMGSMRENTCTSSKDVVL
jgi:hypothetical protein